MARRTFGYPGSPETHGAGRSLAARSLRPAWHGVTAIWPVEAGLGSRWCYKLGSMTTMLRGKTPESWCCVDCGVNTAPGHPNRKELEGLYIRSAVIKKLTGKETPVSAATFNDRCEIYTVRDTVWKTAGMEPMGGCLCVGCLEKRLGRRLRPKDFTRLGPPTREASLPRQRRTCAREPSQLLPCDRSAQALLRPHNNGLLQSNQKRGCR